MEVRRIIEEAEETARHVLTEQIGDLHAIAEALLTYETLSGDEVRSLLDGETISRDDNTDENRPSGRSSVPSTGAGKTARRRPALGVPQVQPEG